MDLTFLSGIVFASTLSMQAPLNTSYDASQPRMMPMASTSPSFATISAGAPAGAAAGTGGSLGALGGSGSYTGGGGGSSGLHNSMNAFMDVNSSMLSQHRDLIRPPSSSGHLLPPPAFPVAIAGPSASAGGPTTVMGSTPPPRPPSSQQQQQHGHASAVGGGGGLFGSSSYDEFAVPVNTNTNSSSNSSSNRGTAAPIVALDPAFLDNESLLDGYAKFLREVEARGLYGLSISTGATASASASGAMNPVDIRKHVTRSRSGGSEEAFGTGVISTTPSASSAAAAAAAAGAGSGIAGQGASGGRRTPIGFSPLVRGLQQQQQLQQLQQQAQQQGQGQGQGQAQEPDDLEVRNAFGGPGYVYPRHPASPSYQQYMQQYQQGQGQGHGGASPSMAAQQAQHAQQVVNNTHIAVGALTNNSMNNKTPNSVAVGSANLGGTSAASAAGAGLGVGFTPNSHLHGGSREPSRSASRCSGVAPPIYSQDELIRANCLSCLPTSSGVGATAGATTATAATVTGSTGVPTGPAGSAPAPAAAAAAAGPTGTGTGTGAGGTAVEAPQQRRVDLKTPKFVRRFMGAGLEFSSSGNNLLNGGHVSGGNGSVSGSIPGQAVRHSSVLSDITLDSHAMDMASVPASPSADSYQSSPPPFAHEYAYHHHASPNATGASEVATINISKMRVSKSAVGGSSNGSYADKDRCVRVVFDMYFFLLLFSYIFDMFCF
jgi:hypothetical protein